ncbi:Clp protease N-terminal domain-containing protein [Bradyrhizobium sp. USDA 4451]
MRDFRDSKAMAHTLRAALATKGLKITIGQILELTAEMFGLPDWNTLAAAIRRGVSGQKSETASRPGANVVWPSGFTHELAATLDRAIAYARERQHEFATLEHLLLALLDDADASAVMKANGLDFQALRDGIIAYIDHKLKTWVTSKDERETTPTVAFRRVVHRATVRSLDRATNGADVLGTMLGETESPAVWLLGQQGMTGQAPQPSS